MITIDDMRRIERAATTSAAHPYSTFLDAVERYEVALGAIWEAWSEAVAEGVDPYQSSLYTVGVQAISRETAAWRRHHGIRDNARAFSAYWTDWQHDQNRPEAVVSRIALWQVLDALPERHVDTLLALATHGNPQDAAVAAGCTYHAMQQRIRAARTAAYALWFDWERPPVPTFDRRSAKPLATHCGRGHEYTPENTRWRKSTSGRGQKRACKACDKIHEARRA